MYKLRIDARDRFADARLVVIVLWLAQCCFERRGLENRVYYCAKDKRSLVEPTACGVRDLWQDAVSG